MLKPTPRTAWLDVLLLALSGAILGVVLYGLFGGDSSEPGYACGGPGPADFGCMGGWEAVAAGILGVLQVLFFVLLFVVAASRLLFRIKSKTNRVK